MEAVGTAEWTGVPLADLLTAAGIRKDAMDVVFPVRIHASSEASSRTTSAG